MHSEQAERQTVLHPPLTADRGAHGAVEVLMVSRGVALRRPVPVCPQLGLCVGRGAVGLWLSGVFGV